ncbi:MAG TPA: hypothetical protein VHX15_15790 [Frankiaceae bacterium]|jgi:hypothetical protein|nr:hypothetical protein [Frankiaceae bacterium]
MDEQPKKVAKIAIRVEWADGQSADLEAIEPVNATYEAKYPDPERDLRDPARLVSRQPPPTITFRFTASGDHGYTERLNAPGSSNSKLDARPFASLNVLNGLQWLAATRAMFVWGWGSKARRSGFGRGASTWRAQRPPATVAVPIWSRHAERTMARFN